MKKHLFKLILCFTPFLFVCFQCECNCCCDCNSPSSYTEWHLKNTTKEKIVLDSPVGEIRKLTTILQESDALLNIEYSNEDDVFDSFWNVGDSVVIELNGEVVRVWRESEKNDSGKQFFNKSSWTKSTGTREEKSCTIWTFEITPEDIVPKE